MRCDVNLSVRPVGEEGFGTRTEIKNINSIAFVGRAIAYEFARQVKILEAGGDVHPQTRRYDEDNDCTVLMREKESEADYRYFPEPDLPPLALSRADIARAGKDLPLMPDKRRVAYRGLGLSEDYARILTETRERSDYFEAVLAHTHHPRAAANLLIGEILPRTGFAPIDLPPESLGEIADMAGEKQISTASARRLIPLCENGRSVADTARAENMMLITDETEIGAMVEQALSENPDVAEQLAAGNTKVLSMLMGAVMRISCGRAEPRLAQTLIDRLAEKY